MSDTETLSYDVIIVGAGPAGLSCAIRYAQMCKDANKPASICILEKGAQVGAHLISGAVFDPIALDELIPNWQQLNAPIKTAVTSDHFYYLSERSYRSLPTPPQMKNQGNYIISLGIFGSWLAEYAEKLGVEIYPGFAVTEGIFKNDRLVGVKIGDLGRDKQGEPKNNFEAGMTIQAKAVVLAEGCRGSLSETLIKRYQLRDPKHPQTYGIGLKEIWQIDPKHHTLGKVVHTVGYPLDPKTYGGSFIYHADNHQLYIGFVVGLDYHDPYFNPYEAFQQFKEHPTIKPLLENGQCLRYGARALNEGGYQAIPKLTFPGGLLIGCSAGFLNVPRIKGNHTAMKSGMLAAETLFEDLNTPNEQPTFETYTQKIKRSFIYKELYCARNIRPAFRRGLWFGLAYAAIDTYLFRGYAPWTFANAVDHLALRKAKQFKKIDYPKHDGKITFDRLLSVSRSGVHHEENQPCHLTLKDPKVAIQINFKEYAGPESRYCPAAVYEFVEEDSTYRLQINASNCIHCKTCDIKDPTQNIVWTPAEGGGGPNYGDM